MNKAEWLYGKWRQPAIDTQSEERERQFQEAWSDTDLLPNATIVKVTLFPSERMVLARVARNCQSGFTPTIDDTALLLSILERIAK